MISSAGRSHHQQRRVNRDFTEYREQMIPQCVSTISQISLHANNVVVAATSSAAVGNVVSLNTECNSR